MDSSKRVIAEQRAFAQCDLSGVDYVYVRADGVMRHAALHVPGGGERPPPLSPVRWSHT